MAYGKRQNPAKAQQARVGNYTAAVDTTGMDPEMKKTMAIGKKKMTLMEKMKSMFKKK